MSSNIEYIIQLLIQLHPVGVITNDVLKMHPDGVITNDDLNKGKRALKLPTKQIP